MEKIIDFNRNINSSKKGIDSISKGLIDFLLKTVDGV
jgi:hypothetical protein